MTNEKEIMEMRHYSHIINPLELKGSSMVLKEEMLISQEGPSRKVLKIIC